MKRRPHARLILSGIFAGCQLLWPAAAATVPAGFVLMSAADNTTQLRLYTNASPGSACLFNTFDLEAYGETLLRSPGGKDLPRWLAASPSNAVLHNVLVNGAGPNLDPTNGLAVLEQASGPEWRYLCLDLTPAYRDRVQQYRRGVLFVEPDLFVIYDHIAAKDKVSFQMRLHPPAAAYVDANWGDLRLHLPKAALRIHAPGNKRDPRLWQRIESAEDRLLPGTVTMQLGPTNQLAAIDLLTVLAVRPDRIKDDDYAFKLVESNTAIGARIHRQGLPTLVAFRVDSAAAGASLDSFQFEGPVGVYVFKPKRRSP